MKRVRDGQQRQKREPVTVSQKRLLPRRGRDERNRRRKERREERREEPDPKPVRRRFDFFKREGIIGLFLELRKRPIIVLAIVAALVAATWYFSR
jgi:hypothetical protein